MEDIPEHLVEKCAMLNIKLTKSKNNRYRYDVYKNEELITTIGAKNFKYYKELIDTEGLDVAMKIKTEWLKRTRKMCDVKTFYTCRLLWCL